MFSAASLIRLYVFIWLALTALTANADMVKVTDDVGNVVTLAQPASRIISLSPHVTELLFEAGAGELIVGTVSFSDFPVAAKNITSVGSANHLDLEKILALQPDLIVAWHSGNTLQDMRMIHRMRIPVFYSEPRRLEGVPRNVERLGALTGNRQTAKDRAAVFKEKLELLRRRYRTTKYLNVYFQLWHQPLMTVNGEHLISDLIELCGGTNVFADISSLTPVVGREAVIRRAPDVVLATGIQHRDLVQNWSGAPTIPAVRTDSLYVISADLLHRQGPRILQGAEQICKRLQEARTRLSAVEK